MFEMVQHWLVKSEPGDWSIDDHKRKKIEHWDGVRNYQANNNMKKMKVGDMAFMYHSISDKAVVGVLKVVREHYPDFTDKTNTFGMVDFEYVKHMQKPVHLEEFKRNPKLQNTALVKQGRLSVMPLTDSEWQEIMLLGSNDCATTRQESGESTQRKRKRQK
jgi:predicted RNA-binding protein with PUA-like domain